MRKIFLLLILTISATIHSQTARGVKIGYIDMEYILQNVPDYTEAKNQLELKAQKWKQDIEAKQNAINALKETLKTERVLLTKELLEEREEEITFQETELSDFQQKKFGPTGDLVIQKAVLVKPIQDQIFTAVQDIAEVKKYDFIFDKSSDLTLLFANKRHDVSDQVIRAITRAAKREQLSRKQLKELEKQEYQESLEDESPELAERRKALEDKKTAREQAIADRKLAAEQRKKEYEDRRAALLAEREARKNGTVSDKDKIEEGKEATTDKTVTPKEEEGKTTSAEEARQKAQEAKEKTIEERKQAIEERKQKILAEREAAKKEREDKLKEKQNENNNNEN